MYAFSLEKIMLNWKDTKEYKEMLAYLETLAVFGGTIQQVRELAQKGVDKLTSQGSKELCCKGGPQ